VQRHQGKHCHSTCCLLQVRFNFAFESTHSYLSSFSNRDCFFSLMTTKFKRILEPSVNPTVNPPRRKALKASGNVLLAFSGGLGSAVLLDLVSQCYFKPVDVNDANPRGGKNHPRNGNVWNKAVICYVEICSAFPGVYSFRTYVSDSEIIDPEAIDDGQNRRRSSGRRTL
jgi:hypothetical protein